MSEPVKPDDIDAVIHERVRLSIVAALAVSAQLSFNELKAMLGLTDGNLSTHARTLDEAGYIVVDKSFRGRRPYTAMRLTPKGRRAFERYLETLRQIVNRGGRPWEIRREAACACVFFSPYTLYRKVLCRRNVMKRWFQALDRILRGEATRPCRAAAQTLDVPAGGLSLVILLLALSYGACSGLYAGTRPEDPSTMQWLATTLKVPALFFSDPGRDLSFVVRFQRLDRLAADRPRCPAASDRLAGGQPGRAGLAGTDRGLLLVQHDAVGRSWCCSTCSVYTVSGLLGMAFLLQTLHRLSVASVGQLPPLRRAGAGRTSRSAICPALDPAPARGGGGAQCAGPLGGPRAGPARENRVLLLDVDLRAGRRANGLGAAAVFRQAVSRVPVVLPARLELLRGCLGGAAESFS